MNANSVAVGVATAGRRAQMQLTLQRLACLDPLPGVIVVAPADSEDFDLAAARGALPGCPVVVAQPRGKGLTVQRNAILDALQPLPHDVVLFLDDDFYPARDYVAQVARHMAQWPGVAGLTGYPVADGARGPGISHAEACRIVAGLDESATPPASVAPTYGTYGCNMSVRLAPVRQHQLRFDESLPLYGWLEDIEFSRRLARHGSIAWSPALRGVHLGIKGGRVSGLRLGYSQVANPLYCVRKGSMSWSYALRHIGRNVAMNLMRSVRPEPWVDRQGRLRGNIRAVWDLLRGTVHPGRVLEI